MKQITTLPENYQDILIFFMEGEKIVGVLHFDGYLGEYKIIFNTTEELGWDEHFYTAEKAFDWALSQGYTAHIQE